MQDLLQGLMRHLSALQRAAQADTVGDFSAERKLPEFAAMMEIKD